MILTFNQRYKTSKMIKPKFFLFSFYLKTESLLRFKIGLFDCQGCIAKNYFVFAALFYIFTIPAILSSFVLYIRSKVYLSANVSQQLTERGKQLRKAFGVIAVLYSVCMIPYIIATPIEQYFNSEHDAANDFKPIAGKCQNIVRVAKIQLKRKKFKLVLLFFSIYLY